MNSLIVSCEKCLNVSATYQLKKISNNKNGPIQKALQANRTELSNEDIKAYFASEIDKGNN